MPGCLVFKHEASVEVVSWAIQYIYSKWFYTIAKCKVKKAVMH